MQVLLLTAFVFFSVHADMYLQSVRGSNNRLDEANRERNNGNRMFDSQNNDRGGYNVGKVSYYADESVPVSFTLQHGCGSEDVKHCDVVLQAMCDPLARDGTTTQRIPENAANCRNFNCDTDVKFGRHESYASYQTCQATERNKGLFQASQQPNRDDATRTRQNPGGTRRGYECPEERDYYPYWNPSPWVDLAIYTKDTGKCDMYKANSQNVQSRFFCNVPEAVKAENNMGIGDTPITQENCDALVPAAANADGNATQAIWTEVPPNGFPVPECFESNPSRPNHLGLVGGETQWTYDWNVPAALVAPGETETSCVFRVRYNISEDYDGTAPDGVDLTTNPSGIVPGPNVGNGAFTTNAAVIDSSFNRVGGGGNPNNKPASLDVWSKYGLAALDNGYNPDANGGDGAMQTFNDGNNGQGLNNGGADGRKIRDYTLRNNPKPDALGATHDDFVLRLQLAVNTAQYGRTFQDRTHVAYVMKKPEEVGNAKIHHYTIAGKRGNIVQVFPGTEYFFQPEKLHVRKYDYVHASFSGSDTNPNNNDGQGKQGTDRSNACVLPGSAYTGNADPNAYIQSGMGTLKPDQKGSLGRNYPAYARQIQGYGMAEALSDCSVPEEYQPPMAGFTDKEMSYLCTLRRDETGDDYGNMEELDDGGTSVNLLAQAKETGCWSVVSTRNNNFSNRSQKSTVCVDEGDYGKGAAGPEGGEITSDAGWIDIPAGAVTQITTLEISSKPSEMNTVVSDVYTITPVEITTLTEDENGTKAKIKFNMPYSNRALKQQKVEHKNANGEWVELTGAKLEEITNDNGDAQTMASVDIEEGGEYRVVDSANAGAIAAIVIGCLTLIATGVFIWWYRTYRMKPDIETDQYAVNKA